MPENEGSKKVIAEYIWIDGAKPTAKLRSKPKVLDNPVKSLEDIPWWGFDGSSTQQAEGHFSDCLLKPVRYMPDPIKGGENIVVLCEVMNADKTPHATNTRAVLAANVEKFAKEDPWFGIEQEYTFMQNGRPYGWPEEGFPPDQGPYYCGVGADVAYGRDLFDEQIQLGLDAGLAISGGNAEVMPAQWEFQLDPLPALEQADQLWLGRWLLIRLGEDYGITVSFEPKPVLGDWNGAGGHTNFSTKAMREDGGLKVIEEACAKLEKRHMQHIKVYGANNELRLTGKHETCSINEFRWGKGDRGASVRVSLPVVAKGKGHMEDRRPAANLDPYQVLTAILETVCGDGFDPEKYKW